MFGIAVFFNGGLGKIKNPDSAYISATALIGTSIFCLALVKNNNFRNTLLHAERGKSYASWPFIFVGVLTLTMGMIVCITA